MTEMTDMLEYAFMRNALLLSALASVTCGIVGSLIRVNRMSSFIGSIAHASFGGLGAAYLFGFDPMVGAAAAAVVSAFGTGLLSGSGRMGSDTATAAMWATGMALGLIFIKLSGTYAADLMSWLFGSLMAVSRSDIIFTGALGLLVTVAVLLLYREILGVSYDQEFTRLQGVPVAAIKGLFLVMAALSVIVMMRVSGLIMVIALLTLPAAVAERFSRSLSGMMAISTALSLLYSLSGLLLAWMLDLPPGPVIILLAAASYFITAYLRRSRR
jgi:zinc transport system permease protein